MSLLVLDSSYLFHFMIVSPSDSHKNLCIWTWFVSVRAISLGSSGVSQGNLALEVIGVRLFPFSAVGICLRELTF